MRTSTAYFAGVGTVVVAIAAGLGGGVILANVMNPNPHQQTSRLEQHLSAQPLAASNQPDEKGPQQSQTPVPYVAPSQAAVTPAPEKTQPQSPTPAQPVQAGNPPSKPSTATPKAASATPAPQPAPHEETATTDDANAKDTNKDANKTRDADSKWQADQRKADRQRQWADRRRRDQQQREQDLRDAQARMQDDDGPRDVVVRRDGRRNWRDDRDAREDNGPPARSGFPGFTVFGPED
jgi:hypothetical protein